MGNFRVQFQLIRTHPSAVSLIGANAEKLVPQACLETLKLPNGTSLPPNPEGILPATSGLSLSQVLCPWQASDKIREGKITTLALLKFFGAIALPLQSTNQPQIYLFHTLSMDFILDVKEKEVGAVKAPSFPQPKANTTGQPEHRKRTRPSAFKQQRQHANGSYPASQRPPIPQTTNLPPNTTPIAASRPASSPRVISEKDRIDQENRDMLASMSAEQIAQERQELLERLDPSIVQMLLRRATIDDDTNTKSVFDEPAKDSSEKPGTSTEGVTTTNPPPPNKKTDKPRKSVRFDEDAAPPTEPSSSSSDLLEATSTPTQATQANPDALAANTTHFPQPASLPDLDPDDPNFLQTLHKKYFPSLPADPSKLAWMAPIPTPGSVADRESPYYPGQSTLSISALRFDFKGRLLPPSRSRSIPVTQGLHHHGEAPEAAGYTIAELGRYARSAVPAQRCVAFQTLGRILYRLGKGEWGGGEADVAKGIWRTAQENRILDTLVEAADVPEGQGHRGSRAYATEAVWLFEKGGWREKFQGR